MNHPLGILQRPENGYPVVGSAEGFDALECLLAVVETRCHAMDAEEGVLDEGGFAPFSGFDTVVGFDMAIDWAWCEPWVAWKRV